MNITVSATEIHLVKFKPSAIVMVTGTAIIIAAPGWSTASVVVTVITTPTSGTADITECTNAGGIADGPGTARREHSVPALRRNVISGSAELKLILPHKCSPFLLPRATDDSGIVVRPTIISPPILGVMPPPVLSSLSSEKSALTTRVLVVDDHPGFRLGVVEMLQNIEGFEVCGEAGDSASAMESFRALEPDLVVMDISLPGRDGIEVTKMMLAERPHTTVLVLTMHDEMFYGLRALKAGAYGYLRKDDTLTQLADAVRHTAHRTHYVSPRLLAQLIKKLAHTPTLEGEGKPAIQGLSDREMEVFHWLAKGLGTRQIANQLGLSVKTIETHRAHIKSKLRLPTAESIVKLAREWHELDERSSSLERNGNCQQVG